LSDVPAALIKSVTVYKTRTADQVEGGTGGVVDVQLRRPLDLKKGLTIAGAHNVSYSSIGDTESPNSSLLVADRFDTPIGEMGFLANVGYAKNRYQENHLVTETVMNFYNGKISDDGTYACQHRVSPSDVGCADNKGNALSAVQPYYMTAYRVWNGIQQGNNTRPTANLVGQWRVNDNLDVVLEGTWLGSTDKGENDYISLKTAGDAAPTYSNIVVQPDGQTIRSMTVTGGANSHPIDLYASYFATKANTYTTNGEFHFHKDKLILNGSVQYDWTSTVTNNVSQQIRVAGLDSATVDFDDPTVNGVKVTLPGVAALTNAANYDLTGLHNEVSNAYSRDFNGQIDGTYEISDTGLLRSVQSGIRLTSHFMRTYFAYRDAYYADPKLALTAFPTGSNLVFTSLGSGFGNSSFYHLNNQSLIANWGQVLTYLQSDPAGKANSGDNWTTVIPDDKDNNSYAEKEFTQAWYGQVNYGFKLFYPVDGVAGVRVIHTLGTSISTSIRAATVDSKGNPVPEVRTNDKASGDFVDYLPSLNGTLHFNDKTQLRLAYTYSVQRPEFAALAGTNHIYYDGGGKPTSGWGGNPELKPMKGPNYDASLEYYFGKGGVASFAAYLKEPSNQFFYANSARTFPALGVTTPIPFGATYNAGKGTYQGYEFNVSGFFEFLPGAWKNFGGGFNYTYNQVFKLEYPVDLTDASQGFTKGPQAWTSKDTYNIQLYYDNGKFNGRIAYNYRSKYFSDRNTDFPNYTYTNAPTSRLDASFSYAATPNLTLVFEGANLLKNNQVGYYGYQYFSAETRLQARTIEIGARFRY
jgi:TonB-dependent receptor